MQSERYELLDKLEPYPIKVRLGEQGDILGGLSAKELEMRIDLRPFMQRTPFIIQVPPPLLLLLPLIFSPAPPLPSLLSEGLSCAGPVRQELDRGPGDVSHFPSAIKSCTSHFPLLPVGWGIDVDIS